MTPDPASVQVTTIVASVVLVTPEPISVQVTTGVKFVLSPFARPMEVLSKVTVMASLSRWFPACC